MPILAPLLASLALAVSATLLFAAPSVVSVAPTPQTITASADAPIVIEFDQAMNPATATCAHLKAWGHWSGMMSGEIHLEAAGTRLRFVPDRGFSAGELVTIFLSHDLQDQGGEPLAHGYSWTYWVRTAPGALLLEEAQRVSVRGTGEPQIEPYGANGGDLNHDGHLDIVMPNGGTHDVRVFLNDGAGGYGAWTSYPIPTGSRPSPNESVDLNGDGILDYAIGNGTGDSVSVFLGIGDGSFGPVRNYQAAPSVRGLALADVDGDGDVDIVTANMNGNNCSILRNQGDGTFAPRVNIDANVDLERSCALADANGDGILDLFVGSHGDDELSLLLGDGNGGFTFSAKVPAGGKPWMIAVGDVNRDGHVDVVSANAFNDNATVVLGDGLGGLAPAVTYPTGSFPIAIDLGDIDGDGDLDLVTSNGGSGTWTVFENDGTGVLVDPVALPGGTASSCATLYDYDNDGDLDLTGIDELEDLIFVFRNGPATVGVGGAGPPASVALEQNSPNPFDPTTRFRFRMPERARAVLRVYDLAGRMVATVIDEVLPAGPHERTFDCRGLPGGVYLYRLDVGGRALAKRMVILR